MKKSIKFALVGALLLALVLMLGSCNLSDIPEELVGMIPDEIKNLHEHPWDEWAMVYGEGEVSLVCNVCKATVKTQPFSEGLDIRDGVLYGIGTCTDKEIVVPYGVTEVAKDAFQGASIKGILLPDTLKSIGNDAFKNCQSMAVIHFPNGLEFIGERAFQNCKALVAIVLPNSVKTLGAHSFENCQLLGAIYYYGVEEDWEKVEKGKDWNKGAGKHAVTYKGVVIAPDGPNPDHESQGLAFELNEDGQSYSVVGIGTCTDTNIVIPSIYEGKPVTGIVELAFSNCTSITSVIIPDSIINIMDGAFIGCDSLTYNEYDNAYYLGNEHNPYLMLIKSKSTDITTCNIPSGTRFIGALAFMECPYLTNITLPEGVTSIGSYAFHGCKSLININIPNSLTKIGNYLFYECFSLNFTEYGNMRYLGNESNPYLLSCGPKHSYVKSCDIHSNTRFIVSGAFGMCSSLTSISIPNSVVSIGAGAFNHCNSLTTVTIECGLTIIDELAFAHCENLTTIIFNGKMEQWKAIVKGVDWDISTGNYTIHCTDGTILNEVHKHTYQETVTSPSCTEQGYTTYACACGNSYIDNYTNPTDHIFGEWTTTKEPSTTETGLKERSCSACGEVESEEIPPVIIDEPTGSQGLEYVLNEDGQSYSVVGIGTCTDMDVVIPSEYNGLPVTTVGECAFAWCESLTSITIGNSIIHIGDSAFMNCSLLTSIVLPDSVKTLGEYGNGVFSGCEALTEITIGSGVENIPDLTFQGTYSLVAINVSPNNEHYKSINGHLYTKDGKTFVKYAGGKTDTIYTVLDGVTYISDFAFSWCNLLTEVIIPDSVNNIGLEAFQYNLLTNIDVSVNNTNYKSIDGNLYSKDGTTLVKYAMGKTDTSFIIPTGVTTIEWHAFNFSQFLTNIIIPNTVTTIKHEAFTNCISLTSVTIPGSVINIWENAFSECTSLTSVIISDGVTSIGNAMFQNCYSLTDIVIPDSVTSIGSYAFLNCKSLTNIELPSSITTIEDGAFCQCYLLTSIVIPKSVKNMGDGVFSRCDSLTIYCESESLPNGWDSTWNNSNRPVVWGYKSESDTDTNFSKGLKYELNPDGQSYSVVGIGTCTDTDVVIPSEYNGLPVTTIKDWLFYENQDITSLYIPQSISEIGRSWALANCPNLSEFIVSSQNQFFKVVDRNLYTKDGTVLIRYAAGQNKTSFTVPDGVTRIEVRAFYGCQTIKNVAIADSVITIDDFAFNQSSIESIVLGNGVVNLNWCCMDGCTFLKNIFIPKQTTNIEDLAFDGCISLEKFEVDSKNPNYSAIDGNLCNKDGTLLIQYALGQKNATYKIPSSITTIGVAAFRRCQTIKSLIISENVKTINSHVFSYCPNLQKVTFEGANINWSGWTFAYCESLETFDLPTQATSISLQMFQGCTSLRKITIPSTVTSIGAAAFRDCTSLEKICFGSSIAQWQSLNIKDVWDSDAPDYTIYCTDGTIAKDGTVTYYTNSDNVSEGLEYELNPDGQSYSVVGIGTFTGNELVVPAFYNGKPVTDIGTGAFCHCDWILNITLPETIRNIGHTAFADCFELLSINIPRFISNLPPHVFGSCVRLKDIAYGGTVEEWNNIPKGEYWDSLLGSLYGYCNINCKDGTITYN